VLHRCRTGLVIFGEFGNHAGLAEKPTRLRSTSRYVSEQLDLKCVFSSPHANLHGEPLLKAQNYEKPLARLLAKVILKGIYDTKRACVTEEVEPNLDDAESKELHAEHRSSFDADVIKSEERSADAPATEPPYAGGVGIRTC
jgi:hypothetical protein